MVINGIASFFVAILSLKTNNNATFLISPCYSRIQTHVSIHTQSPLLLKNILDNRCLQHIQRIIHQENTLIHAQLFQFRVVRSLDHDGGDVLGGWEVAILVVLDGDGLVSVLGDVVDGQVGVSEADEEAFTVLFVLLVDDYHLGESLA